MDEETNNRKKMDFFFFLHNIAQELIMLEYLD